MVRRSRLIAGAFRAPVPERVLDALAIGGAAGRAAVFGAERFGAGRFGAARRRAAVLATGFRAVALTTGFPAAALRAVFARAAFLVPVLRAVLRFATVRAVRAGAVRLRAVFLDRAAALEAGGLRRLVPFLLAIRDPFARRKPRGERETDVTLTVAGK